MSQRKFWLTMLALPVAAWAWLRAIYYLPLLFGKKFHKYFWLAFAAFYIYTQFQ